MFRKIAFPAVACMMALAAASAHSAIITFGDGPSVASSGYTETGFVITTSSPYARIRDWPTTNNPSSFGSGSGEREFLFNGLDGTITFKMVSGGLFDFTSFDVENPAGQQGWSADGTVVVTGSNGAVANFSGSSFVTNLLPNSFSNLTYVTFSNQTGQSTIDNLNFAASAVPEPATTALLGLGLLGFAASRRKSAKSKNA
jgi:hypothetical protein